MFARTVRNFGRLAGFTIPIHFDAPLDAYPELEMVDRARDAMFHLQEREPYNFRVAMGVELLSDGLDHFSDGLLTLDRSARIAHFKAAVLNASSVTVWLASDRRHLSDAIASGEISEHVLEALVEAGRSLTKAARNAQLELAEVALACYQSALEHCIAAGMLDS
ncbi:MAG: hypothetical protein KDD60_11265 [Bdellovibrionales bacterium]|nr:hypothetical protein [Bdellovibrionales bacterium]